jgi:lysyl-tRNA synthetase, class II
MSRPSLTFLRPHLRRATQPATPELARAYLSIRKRFIQTINAAEFTGPHDVEKQKRLDHLAKVKALGDYHPRLTRPAGAASLSLREFNTTYHDIQETKLDIVAVFGMTFISRYPKAMLTALGRVRSVRLLGSKLVFLDIERDTQRLQVMVELKKLDVHDGLEDSFKAFKKIARLGDWICKYHRRLQFKA